MATKTAIIARAVQLTSGRGTYVFNDRLLDGRRSLKVWGWTEADYMEAAHQLAKAGCVVKVHKFKPTAPWLPESVRNTQRIRLHITE